MESQNVSTPVEMNLTMAAKTAKTEECLHTRGDEPIFSQVKIRVYKMSPHPWR